MPQVDITTYYTLTENFYTSFTMIYLISIMFFLFYTLAPIKCNYAFNKFSLINNC